MCYMTKQRKGAMKFQKCNEISTPIMPRAPTVRGWEFVDLTKTLKLTNQPGDLGAGNTDKGYTLFI